MAGATANSIELATAYISINARTDSMSKQIKAAFAEVGKHGDEAGRQAAAGMGTRMRESLGSMSWVKQAMADSAKGAGDKAAQGFFQEFRTTSQRVGAIGGKVFVTAFNTAVATADMGSAIRKTLNATGVTKMAGDFGKSIGRTAAMSVKASIAGVGLSGALSVGAVLTGGLDRLKNIDAATFKLKALGNSAEDVKSIMDSALAAVDKTAFGLGDAATAAASAVAAGVKPGTDLTKYLTTVGDAAAIANTGFDEMGAVFNKVTTGGKAFTDDLNMLRDRGIPIFTWLQKEYGVTGDALSDMVSNGQVDAATFQKVIADNIGGAAKNMGGSFDGSLKNFKASIDRVGANFLAPLLGDSESKLGGVTSALGNLTGKLDILKVWAGTHQGTIRQFFAGVAEAAMGGAAGVSVSIGAIISGFGKLVGGVGNAVGVLLKGRAAISDFFGNHEDADRARSAAETAFGWGEGIQKAGDSLIHFGQSIMDSTSKVKAWGDAGKNSADLLTDALGGAVTSVNGKEIVLKSNTPEVAKKLDDLGVKVQNLPDGEVKLVPNTPEAQAAVDEWLSKNNPTAQPVTTAVEVDTASADQKLQGFIGKWSQYLFGGMVDPVVKNPLTAPYQGGAVQNPLTAPFEQGTGSYGPARTAVEPPTRLPVGGGGQGYMDIAGMSAYLDNISATRNMDMTGLKPGAQVMKRAVYAMFPNIKDIGGYRAHDPYPDHPSGNALDIMVPDAATGNAVNDYILQNRSAFGLQYDLWQQKTWRADGSVSGMEDRGSPTQNHMDHVHGMSGGAMSGAPKFPWDIGFRLIPKTYDSGGWLDPGQTLVNNDSGKPELVLTHDQAQALQNGDPISPNSTQHGLARAGSLPGPRASDMLKALSQPVQDPNNPDQKPDYGQDFFRSLGFIPASAGNTGVAGTSSLAGFINMGNSVVSGVIDTGVNLANQAVSAAIMAGAAGGGMGAGAAAAPLADMAASYGIQLAGNQAKRVSQWGFQMLGIGADALMEQMFPFGAPRWLGYDYTQFAPQLGVQQAATSSLEKMGSDAINKQFNPQQAASGPSADIGLGTKTAPPPSIDMNYVDLNLASPPPAVLGNQQWDSIRSAAANPPAAPTTSAGSGATYHVYAQDTDDAIRRLRQKERLDSMQYTGRF